jgi:hypothetical protein
MTKDNQSRGQNTQSDEFEALYAQSTAGINT